MTAESLTLPYVAQSRFGFGPVPGHPIPGSPVDWLSAQVGCPDPVLSAGQPTGSQGLALLGQFRASAQGSSGQAAAAGAISAFFAADVNSYLAGLVTSALPFRERLVSFWANHFAVMALTFPVAVTAGPFVREAIRPYVNGTFAQMLQAAVTHPAMLYSLNGDSSVGFSSPVAVRAAKSGQYFGMNENLGRETLELYSVSLLAGYAQSDVDALANLLAGLKPQVSPQGGGTVFNPACCDPGSVVLLGVTYPVTQAGLQAALHALGTSPYSYMSIATQLVTHFVSDAPAPADVASVYDALCATGGNLGSAALALLQLPSAWAPLSKVRTPLELVVAALRAASANATNIPSGIAGAIATMGMPLWQPPFPNGWSLVASDWVGPGSMSTRVDYLSSFASELLDPDVPFVLAEVLGPLASAATQAAVAGAASPAAQMAMLLCSPEFQRR